MYDNIMLDLETLGTSAGATVLSIGMVAFTPHADILGSELYLVVNRDDSRLSGLREDPDTVQWWSRQSPEAQEVLRAAEKSAVTVNDACIAVNGYLATHAQSQRIEVKELKIWGNGSDFDQPILAGMFDASSWRVRPVWRFYNNRCYRTLKNLVPGASLERVGTYHNALDDAKSQALHAMKLLRSVNHALAGDQVYLNDPSSQGR